MLIGGSAFELQDSEIGSFAVVSIPGQLLCASVEAGSDEGVSSDHGAGGLNSSLENGGGEEGTVLIINQLIPQTGTVEFSASSEPADPTVLRGHQGAIDFIFAVFANHVVQVVSGGTIVRASVVSPQSVVCASWKKVVVEVVEGDVVQEGRVVELRRVANDVEIDGVLVEGEAFTSLSGDVQLNTDSASAVCFGRVAFRAIRSD